MLRNLSLFFIRRDDPTSLPLWIYAGLCSSSHRFPFDLVCPTFFFYRSHASLFLPFFEGQGYSPILRLLLSRIWNFTSTLQTSSRRDETHPCKNFEPALLSPFLFLLVPLYHTRLRVASPSFFDNFLVASCNKVERSKREIVETRRFARGIGMLAIATYTRYCGSLR